MSKEKVFIVVSHVHSLRKGSRTDWEVHEKVEFVNHLKNKHIRMSSAIGDYINQKMMSGAKFGFDEYAKFDSYIRKKYTKQLEELDAAYRDKIEVPMPDDTPVFADEFGNIRTKTIFDK